MLNHFPKLFLIFLLLSLVSCDALVQLPYVVKNCGDKTVPVKIENSGIIDTPGYLVSSNTKDTVINLKPGESIEVSKASTIYGGFFWHIGRERKKMYTGHPGVKNFDVLVNDSVMQVDKSDANWKFRHGQSVFRIGGK